MLSRTMSLLTTSVLCASVGDVEQVSAQVGLPRLSLAFESKTIEASPQSAFLPIAVGPQGHVLIQAESNSGFRLFLLDSTGAIIQRLGRNGEGPGESRNPLPVHVGPTTVAAWDDELLRLTEWGTDGSMRRSVTVKTPMAVGSPYRDGYYGFAISGQGFKPVRLNVETGATAPLLSPTDTFFQAQFKRPTPSTRLMVAPVFGEWRDGFVIASTESYRIGLYGHDGQLVRVLGREPMRVLPSRARVERQVTMHLERSKLQGRRLTQEEIAEGRKWVEETPVPNFALATPLGTDAHGRLWVMGIEGDSAFADVFTPERFIGRMAVSCPGFEGKWSISGRWLAMVCAPTDEEFEGDVVVKLFRVT